MNKAVQQDPARGLRIRLGLIGIGFMILLTIIAGRAVYLQVCCNTLLAGRAVSQYESSLTIQAKRGTIYDANHDEMAVSIKVPSVTAYPQLIKDKQGTARALAGILQINSNKLYQKLNTPKTFVWIKRQVTPREKLRIKKLKLTGINFIQEYKRFYPNRELAAQLLGFTGIDGHGLEGLEFSYEDTLKGRAEKYIVFKDALGRSYSNNREQNSDNIGDNLILTLDRTIQFITEKALAEAITQHSAKSGMVIVMAPDTGAILAMANYPFFNPNTFGKFKRWAWRNRVVTDMFEPGSTMKIFSAAVGLELGHYTPESIFYCEEGSYQVGKNIIRDTRSHGWLTMSNIIKFSSNIGIIKLTEKIGHQALYNGLKNFGFGTKTKIKYPGETSGSLTNYQRWSKIDTAAISFGHGISVSALQMVTAVSAIANNGILMQPYLVQAITDSNGKILKNKQPVKIKQVVSKKTTTVLKKIMQTVVTEGGTGTRAALQGYKVCGKTGTAQKLDAHGNYTRDKYLASFIGFVPAQKPVMAMLVIIDEPENEYYGGKVAAPVFQKIAHATLNYLDILPQRKSGQLMAKVEK